MSIDLERAQREELRWRILKCLDVGRPGPVNEKLILRVAYDVKLPVTPTTLRRELQYLESRDLVTIEKIESVWFPHLTRHGIDLVEYTTECHPGIARPEKYWGSSEG